MAVSHSPMNLWFIFLSVFIFILFNFFNFKLRSSRVADADDWPPCLQFQPAFGFGPHPRGYFRWFLIGLICPVLDSGLLDLMSWQFLFAGLSLSRLCVWWNCVACLLSAVWRPLTAVAPREEACASSAASHPDSLNTLIGKMSGFLWINQTNGKTPAGDWNGCTSRFLFFFFLGKWRQMNKSGRVSIGEDI